jgi:hypothetical protein
MSSAFILQKINKKQLKISWLNSLLFELCNADLLPLKAHLQYFDG